MKKVALFFLVLFLTGSFAFAEEEKAANFVQNLLDVAFSPVDKILGSSTVLDEIVVTPSKVGEKLSSTSCSISVITKEDLDATKIDTPTGALRYVPGLDVVQTGPFQGTTDLYMRGAKSGQTLILVDGIRASDAISISGAYDISHLTMDNIDQIEVLRGPQSALYGTDAMAGVISFQSKRTEKPYAEVSFEGGSFFTFREHAEFGSANNGFHYNVSCTRLDTKGISQAQAKRNCQERDPYDQTGIATRCDYDIGDKGSIGTTFRYIYGNYDCDYGANRDDDTYAGKYYDSFFTLYGNCRLLENWDQSLRLGWMEAKRLYACDDDYVYKFNRSKYVGDTFRLTYENTLEMGDYDTVIIGYEHTEEIGDYYSEDANYYTGVHEANDMPKVFDRSDDFYLENRINYKDRLTSTQGMRVTHHSRAGTYTTCRFDGSYLFHTGTKVRGLIATGFKAPTLYQLYAPSITYYFDGGNPDLQPEKSFSYEFGADQYLMDGKITAQCTYFFTIYDNLIDARTNPTTWVTEQYRNIGKAQVHGIETSLSMNPVEQVKISTGLTYQATKDFSNDQELPRRPKYKFFIETLYHMTKNLSFDVRVRYNGPSSNNLSNPSWGTNSDKIKEYTVVDMTANYDISKNFSVYMKVDNLFNKYYEEARGYTTSPFALYGGVKAKF